MTNYSILGLKLNSNSKWPAIAVAIYILIFLITRLVNLTAIPLSIDEVRHIIWSQATANGDLFHGLREGLRLTYIWFLALAFKFFDDSLLIIRVTSVLAGLVSGGICYKLTAMLYPDRQLGYLAALFYLFSPFTLFYNRLGLADSFLTMLIGFSLLVSIQLWRHPSVRWTIAFGFVLGLAVLTKVYAVLYYVMPILCWLFLGRKISWGKIVTLMSIATAILILPLLLTFIISQELLSAVLASNSTSAALSVDAGLLGSFSHNVLLIAKRLGIYLTPPFIGLFIFTLVMIVTKRDRPGIILTILMVLHSLLLIVVFTIWYPRYLLPTIVPMSVILTRGIDYLADFIFLIIERTRHNSMQSPLFRLVFQGVIFLMLCIPSLSFGYWIITEPYQAPLPSTDRWSYFEDQSTGYGVEESAQVIRDMSEQYPKLTVLGNKDTFDGAILTSYLQGLDKVSFQTIDNFDPETIKSLNAYAREGPTLAIKTLGVDVDGDPIPSNDFGFLDSSRHPQVWQLASFPKPGNLMEVNLYQWLLPPDFALHWFQQGGDADPRIARYPSDTLVTTGGILIDWPQTSAATPETMQQTLAAANVEYVFANPELVNSQPDLFAPFMTTDGARLRLNQLPPGWRLAFVYPDVFCEWCLFQLKSPDYPTQTFFGESVELAGYDVSATQLSPGEALHITLYWNSLEPLPEAYLIFVHLLDADGRLVGQVDEPPLQGKWPTNNWRTGDRLADRHTMRLSQTLPAGDYKVLAGLYNSTSLERLPIRGEKNLALDNALILMTLSVK